MPLARNLAAMFSKLRGGKASGLLKKAAALRKNAGKAVGNALGVSKTASAATNRAAVVKRAGQVKAVFSSTAAKGQGILSKLKSARMSDASAKAVQKFQSIDPNKLRSGAQSTVRRVGQVAKTAGTATVGYAKANPFKTAAAATAVGYAAGKRRQKQRMMRGLNQGRVRRSGQKKY